MKPFGRAFADMVPRILGRSTPPGHGHNGESLIFSWISDILRKPQNSILIIRRRNERTGRITLIDPDPPPPRNYLDLNNVKAHMKTIEETPESPEFIYRRAMAAIIKSVFKDSEGFEVVQEETRGPPGATSLPDFVVLKIIARRSGSLYVYDYCLVESKKLGEPWGATEGHLSIHCQDVDNELKKVYGIVHVGMHIQVYQADQGALTELSGRMHLRNDVSDITAWLQYIKNNPLPVA